jgi:hypothetical protein
MASVLSQHFAPPGSDIEAVVPTDWSETAGVDAFQGIEDAETRELALKIFSLWPLLFCKACSVNCLHLQLASALKQKLISILIVPVRVNINRIQSESHVKYLRTVVNFFVMRIRIISGHLALMVSKN